MCMGTIVNGLLIEASDEDIQFEPVEQTNLLFRIFCFIVITYLTMKYRESLGCMMSTSPPFLYFIRPSYCNILSTNNTIIYDI